MTRHKRYGIVGTGSRHVMYRRAVTERYRDICELVALCDHNQGRLDLSRENLLKDYGPVPTYPDADFDRMIAERQPDTVIVTTRDPFPDPYISRALDTGCAVTPLKPTTRDQV